MKERQQTSLFARIMIRLSVPLFFLGAIFTAIQLTNQINAMNHFYSIESRVAFEAIRDALHSKLRNPQTLQDPEAIKSELRALAKIHRVTDVRLYDLLQHASFFSDDAPWTPSDYRGIEESLLQKKEGRSYYVRVDKNSRFLLAYIPIEDTEGKPRWVARTLFSLASVQDALVASQRTLILMFSFIVIVGIIIGRTLAKSIVEPIQQLNEATQEIMIGHLGKHVTIRTGDEIETLAHTFNHMSEALKVMKRQAEDANPLTQLPGNQGILTELKKRIFERQKFVLFHADLDRFKTFNDHYGLARGDEAIKKTADLLSQAVKEKGAADDFVGHQGGDDFVIITRPNHAKAVAEYVVKNFDGGTIRSLYRKEDFERGYTLAPDRRSLAETGQEVMVKFPLLAISLAGVSTAKKDFADYFDCMSAAAEVKKEVKKTVQSIYLIQE